MKTFLNRNPVGLFATSLALFLSLEFWIVRLIQSSQDPELLSTGVAIDITLGIPLLFYFFVVRKLRISHFSLIPVFFASLWIATFLLPRSNQDFLSAEKKLIPVIEILLIGYVFSRIPGFAARYRHQRSSTLFFSDAVFKAAGLSNSGKKVLKALATELMLMYLAFAGWFKKFRGAMNDHSIFSYHRRSGYTGILSILAFLLLVETAVVHIVILHWSSIAANIVTGLSIYSLFWLIGDYHAVRIHPVVVTKTELLLRIGLRWRADIPLTKIRDIRIGGNAPAKSKDYLRASILWPRVFVDLTEPVEVQGMFGMTRKITQLGLSIDDQERFRQVVLSKQ